MPRVRFSSLLPFLICLLFAPHAASAGVLRGRVVDPQGAVVRGATVVVVRGTEVIASLQTGADGTYGPQRVDAGDYELDVAADGFRAGVRHVTVAAGTTPLDVDFALQISAVSESVVVSAAQVAEPLSHVPDAVTVIDRAQMTAEHLDTLADALRLAPGLGVVASGAPGQVTSLFPRGGESDYTLVLVDGIPQNRFGGYFDAAHLATEDVDHVEVVRGPESALFGGGAIGAVVDVVTRTGGPLRFDASTSAGSYGTTHAGGSVAGGNGPWGVGASIDRFATSGDTRFVPALGQHVTNDDYERTSGSGTVSWTDRPGLSARFTLRGATNDVGNPGPYGSDPLGLYAGLDTVSRSHNRDVEFGASAVLSSAGGSTDHRIDVSRVDLASRYTSPYGPSTDETRRWVARYQFDVNPSGAFGLSLGGELQDERADNTYILGVDDTTPVPVRRTVGAGFGEARFNVGGRLFLDAGARLERIDRSALQGDPAFYGPRPAFSDDVVWSPNPKVAAAWYVRAPSASGWTKLRVGAGTGIRPPSAFEIAFTDNPDLKPERNRSVDGGVEQAFAGGRVVVEADAFANRYTDLIVTVGSSLAGASRYRTDNIANAAARGLELGATWRGAHGLGARASFTWLHTEVLAVDHLPAAAPPPYEVGQALVRRPKAQGTIDLTWTAARGSLFLSANGRDAVLDLEPNDAQSLFPNPGYVVVDAGGSLRVARLTALYVRATNLFDRSYEEALGYPALGRAVQVGIRVAGGR